MRRMFSKNQLNQLIYDFLENNPSDVAEAIGLAGTVSEDIGVKPLYSHNVLIRRTTGSGYFIEGYLSVINNSSNAYTVTDLMQAFATAGFSALVFSGVIDESGSDPSSSSKPVTRLANVSETQVKVWYRDQNNTQTSTNITLDATQWAVADSGIKKIN